ncbi:MAG TPA: LysE family translocator [Candidatus Polarisedimenticolia bacterium]|nr:LysE family translocator [Candidatus Polarisedimenticolia bacterium]
MTWQTWGLFMVTETALCLTPGPAVLFVVSQALSFGAARSLWANLGILTANALYFALSALGLGAVLMASHRVFLVIKWAGAAYLIYLGLRTFFAREATLPSPGGPAHPGMGWKLLGRGVILQAANPKSLIFFTALLPQFIDPKGAVGWQVLILGVSSVVVEFFVLSGYGVFAGRAATLAREPRYSRLTHRLAGACLVLAGTGVALTGKD